MFHRFFDFKEMSAPKISIIVPVYKAENYLSRCVDSLLAQTFQDFEILLVDDGSPDRSGKICDEYAKKDNRVRVFHKENGGVSSARNLGIEQGRGEWIIFCDSDDWVDVNWLEQYCEALLEDVDMVFQGYVREDNHKQVLHVWKDCLEKAMLNIIYGLELRNLFGWTWIKIFRADIIKRYAIRFNVNISKNEDTIFTLEYCLHIHKIRVLSVAAYHYRNTPFSLVSKHLPYEEVNLKNEEIFKLRMQLCARFPLDNKYRQWTIEDYKEQSVYALLSLYSNQYKESSEKRKAILKKTRLLIKDFVPKGELGKVIVFMLMLLKNDYCADCLLKFGLRCWLLVVK